MQAPTALVLALALVLAACSDTATSPPTVLATSSPTSTTAGNAEELGDGPTPATIVADHLSPPTESPHGPLPTFNESPGCHAPQGIRGPYADSEGDVPDTQVLGGPWAEFFGRDMAEVRDHLVAMQLPNADPLPPVTVFVHDRVAPALQAVIENLEQEKSAGRSYPLDPASVFSFRPATVPPNRYLSFHAIGAAIDVNADTNPYREDNVLITDMPAWFVDAWVRAGWCWGGSWQQIKDPMHFSWMGPLHTPGYPMPEPIPPRTPAGSFTRSVRFGTGLGPAGDGSRQFAVDMDRDGAPDGVRLVTAGPDGGVTITTAGAIHRFNTCTTTGPTPHGPDPSYPAAFADATGDGRPDLWELAPGNGDIVVTIFTFISEFTRHLPARLTEGVDADARLLLADHDRDGISDLYIVVPGSPTTIEIRLGPDLEPSVPTVVPLDGDPGWRYALGRRDADWIPDLYALGPGDPATLFILAGGDGFALSETLTTAIGVHNDGPHPADLDGDGWEDLLFMDRDGSITAYLGGDRGGTPDADLTAWLLNQGAIPWEHGSGCPVDHGPYR